MGQQISSLVKICALCTLILSSIGIAAWRWLPFYAPELTVMYSPFAEPITRIYLNQDAVNKLNYKACRYTDFGSEDFILTHINRCVAFLIEDYQRIASNNDDPSEERKCKIRYPLITCYEDMNSSNRQQVNDFIRSELRSSNIVNQREMIYYITEMYWEREESLARQFFHTFSPELLHALAAAPIDGQCHHAILSFFQYFAPRNKAYIQILQQQLNRTKDPLKLMNLCLIFQSLGAEAAPMLAQLRTLMHDQRQCLNYSLGFDFKQDPPFVSQVGSASLFTDAGFIDEEKLVSVSDYATDAVNVIEACLQP